MNEKVDQFLNKAPKWQKEMQKLRAIVLDCMLTEDFKWRQPCYSYQDSNLVIISAFKDYCVLGFFKGALLSDANKLFVKPGDNSQSMRQIRFTDVETIIETEPVLKAYIYEAIEAEKAGLKVQLKKTSEYEIPEEFQRILDENRALKLAFEALTAGRQRAYLLYFAQPKQSKTREARIEKYMEHILKGKGLMDN